MAFRSDFTEALTLLARGIAEMVQRKLEPPILVGGAAVEFYTSGHVMSADFDLVTPHQDTLHEVLHAHGFVHAAGPGVLAGGLVHPHLHFGVQVVSGQLMDGKADHDKLFVLDLEGGQVTIIAVEDLIADRMGQAYSIDPPRKDVLDQAVKLLQLAETVDRQYLDRRIREETLEAAKLSTLEGLEP